MFVLWFSFLCSLFFFFKQKTAYEMRISDWSSDVCSADAAISVKGRDHPWVSRGGIKLDHALKHWGVHLGWNVAGAAAIDVGSSTGGFTYVLLHRGVRCVHDVDSGTHPLPWKLRQGCRVIRSEEGRVGKKWVNQ